MNSWSMSVAAGFVLTLNLAVSVQAAESPSFHYDGVVVDQMTRPLAGALVKVIGTDRSATTDAKGAFTVTGKAPSNLTKSESFPLVEISANGCEPSTYRPESLTVKGLTTMVWAFPEPKEGARVDHARWGYLYRKGFAGNPLETRWLPPDDSMFCGLLFEVGRGSNSDNILSTQNVHALPQPARPRARCR